MSLNKAIQYNKEYRKPYKGGKAISYRCRNHGGCPWCLENRMYKTLKTNQKMVNEMEEYLYNDN